MPVLTRWALDTALGACAAWQRTKPGVGVAVNLSSTDVQSADLPGVVAAMLERHGLPASLLALELTETTLMTDVNSALEVLGALSSMGVSIAIDDFGTGFCSLAYLRRLPVDLIKIDHCFVSEMLDHQTDSAIVSMVVALARTLGLRTVAEGVQDGPTAVRARDVRRGSAARNRHRHADDRRRLHVVGSGGVRPAFVSGPPVRSAGIGPRTGRCRPHPASSYRAVRQLLHAESDEEVVGALMDAVRDLGGSVVPAQAAPAHALPVDISFGIGDPLLPVTGERDGPRVLLTELPHLLDDARTALERIHRADPPDATTTDPLTGLVNRQVTLRHLRRMGYRDAVAMIDLDHLDRIIDSFGQDASDDVLRSFARTLRSVTRAADTVGRIGDEEFVWLLPDTRPETAHEALQHLRTLWTPIRSHAATFSAGVAAVGERGPVAALLQADEALDAAKRSGRDRVRVS